MCEAFPVPLDTLNQDGDFSEFVPLAGGLVRRAAVLPVCGLPPGKGGGIAFAYCSDISCVRKRL